MGCSSYVDDYSSTELMAVVASREIRNDDRVFVGIGVPMIAAFLAIHSHAPNAVLMFEGGYVGSHPPFACTDVGDSTLGCGSPYVTSLWRMFSDLQRGYCDLAMIGAAQVDKYGNVNSTAILDDRTYEHPKVRLPGSGGANDMASSARRVVIMARLDKRRFVSRIDHVTSPGHIDGAGGREKKGLMGGGPVSVVTDRAVFRFDKETKEMYLNSVCPSVTPDDVTKQVGWQLKFAQKVNTVAPPTREEVDFIRRYDPTDVILRKKRLFETLDFSSWISLIRYQSR